MPPHVIIHCIQQANAGALQELRRLERVMPHPVCERARVGTLVGKRHPLFTAIDFSLFEIGEALAEVLVVDLKVNNVVS